MLDPMIISTGVALVGALGIGGIAVAVINKRPDPFAQAQQIIDTLQEERVSDATSRTRLESKLDVVYESLGAYREYATEWELWHAEGMPNPPGRPTRPALLGRA